MKIFLFIAIIFYSCGNHKKETSVNWDSLNTVVSRRMIESYMVGYGDGRIEEMETQFCKTNEYNLYEVDSIDIENFKLRIIPLKNL